MLFQLIARDADDEVLRERRSLDLVLSVIRWRDEEKMFDEVHAVEYGLTAAIYTTKPGDGGPGRSAC